MNLIEAYGIRFSIEPDGRCVPSDGSPEGAKEIAESLSRSNRNIDSPGPEDGFVDMSKLYAENIINQTGGKTIERDDLGKVEPNPLVGY